MKIKIKIDKRELGDVARGMGMSGLCPGAVGLKDAEGSECGFGLCARCWKDALKEGAKSRKSFFKRKDVETA